VVVLTPLDSLAGESSTAFSETPCPRPVPERDGSGARKKRLDIYEKFLTLRLRVRSANDVDVDLGAVT